MHMLQSDIGYSSVPLLSKNIKNISAPHTNVVVDMSFYYHAQGQRSQTVLLLQRLGRGRYVLKPAS